MPWELSELLGEFKTYPFMVLQGAGGLETKKTEAPRRRGEREKAFENLQACREGAEDKQVP